jgi:hypothetical protein
MDQIQQLSMMKSPKSVSYTTGYQHQPLIRWCVYILPMATLLAYGERRTYQNVAST